MELLRKPVTIVWAALMLATCASTWLLSKNSVTPEVATVAILLIAAVKVRLVMTHFMEVRRAPLALRLRLRRLVARGHRADRDRLPGLIRRTRWHQPMQAWSMCVTFGLRISRCQSALRSMRCSDIVMEFVHVSRRPGPQPAVDHPAYREVGRVEHAARIPPPGASD